MAQRWRRVIPARDDAIGEPVEPGAHDMPMLAANSEWLAELRERFAKLL